MALTTNIKRGRINVATGETDHEYYDDVEWAQVLADRATNRLPKAKSQKRRSIRDQANRLVDAIIMPPELFQAQVRALELLEIRIVNGSWTPAEQQERDDLGETLAETRVIRSQQEVAYSAIANATTVAQVRAITLEV